MEEISHTTRAYKREVTQPRLSFFAAGHPHRLVELIEIEKDVKKSSDGLVSRILYLNPKPCRMELSNKNLIYILNLYKYHILTAFIPF